MGIILHKDLRETWRMIPLDYYQAKLIEVLE